MSRKQNILLLLLIVCRAAWAVDPALTGDLRYDSSTANPDTVDGTVIYGQPFRSWLHGEFGTRLAISAQDLDRLDGKAEAVFPVVSFFSPHLRLTHSYSFVDTSSATTILAAAELHGFPLPFLGLFVTFGWYERFIQLSNTLIVPTPFLASTTDQDFATVFGFEILPARNWRFVGKAGTIEDVDVFNLNNPYFGADLEYHSAPSPFSWRVYARYQVLLGFGRLDQFISGIALKWDLSDPIARPVAGN